MIIMTLGMILVTMVCGSAGHSLWYSSLKNRQVVFAADFFPGSKFARKVVWPSLLWD